MRRGFVAFLVALAAGAGLAGSLFYTWILDPVEYYDSAPDALYVDDKLVYLVLIGDIYAHDEDLAGAKAELAQVGVDADGEILAGLIEQYLDGGGQPEDMRNLARLANDLGARGGVLLVFDAVSTPAPTPTATTLAQSGASPTPPPIPATPEPAFRLVEQTSTCADPGQQGQIAVWVRDEQGNPMPGIEVVVSWPQGQDRFFTGLRPEQGAGYADFGMKPGTRYEVGLDGFRGDMAEGLTMDLSPGVCPTGTLALNWRLAFERIP
jgi:hypothetical protein